MILKIQIRYPKLPIQRPYHKYSLAAFNISHNRHDYDYFLESFDIDFYLVLW